MRYVWFVQIRPHMLKFVVLSTVLLRYIDLLYC